MVVCTSGADVPELQMTIYAPSAKVTRWRGMQAPRSFTRSEYPDVPRFTTGHPFKIQSCIIFHNLTDTVFTQMWNTCFGQGSQATFVRVWSRHSTVRTSPDVIAGASTAGFCIGDVAAAAVQAAGVMATRAVPDSLGLHEVLLTPLDFHTEEQS